MSTYTPGQAFTETRTANDHITLAVQRHNAAVQLSTTSHWTDAALEYVGAAEHYLAAISVNAGQGGKAASGWASSMYAYASWEYTSAATAYATTARMHDDQARHYPAYAARNFCLAEQRFYDAGQQSDLAAKYSAAYADKAKHSTTAAQHYNTAKTYAEHGGRKDKENLYAWAAYAATSCAQSNNELVKK